MSETAIALSPSDPADYAKFLAIKRLPRYRFVGRTAFVPSEYMSLIGGKARAEYDAPYEPLETLFDYQRDISRLSIAKRKFALFIAPGLGKTLIQAEFARHAAKRLPKRRAVLMIAPPMIVPQTMEELAKFYGNEFQLEHLNAKTLPAWMESGSSRIGITNYEALKDSTPTGRLGALVCDETSCWKSFGGKWASICLRLGRGLEWKLSSTGTPAPNDRIEFANQAVFLDQFPNVNSFLARFFVNRGQTDNRWELKPHALGPFYRSLSHWCVFLNDPATYEWKDNAGTIPPIHVHIEDVSLTSEQRFAAMDLTGAFAFDHPGGIGSRSKLGQIAKGKLGGKQLPTNKPEFIRNLVSSWPDESTIIWTIYNAEQDSMDREFPDAASIRGETKFEKRLELLADFKAGRRKVLISKADVLGFGLNLQVCTRMIFSGLQDSYEDYYQCVKRANRVRATKPLHVYIPVTEIERPMIDTVLRKARMIEQDTAEQERIFKEISVASERNQR